MPLHEPNYSSAVRLAQTLRNLSLHQQRYALTKSTEDFAKLRVVTNRAGEELDQLLQDLQDQGAAVLWVVSSIRSDVEARTYPEDESHPPASPGDGG